MIKLGDKYFIALNDSTDAVSGTFANAPANTFTDGVYVFSVNYADNFDNSGASNDISLLVTAVPEPGTWIAGGLAFLFVGYTQRKRFARALKRA